MMFGAINLESNMPKPQIRNEKLQQLAVELYEKLKSGNAVAKRLEISGPTCYRMLRDAGVHIPDRHSDEVQNRKKKLHGDLARAAAEDYAGGMSTVDLKSKHGVGLWAIRTAVKELGMPMRLRGGKYRVLTSEEKAEVVRLYCEDQFSQVQVAAKFGCSQAVVSRTLREAGADMRGHNKRGSDHHAWRGGRVKIGKYVNVYVAPDDPLAVMRDSMGYVLEHRLVMARSLGRPLLDSETVHHINGDTGYNDLSNLQLRQGKHGKGVVMYCLKCGSTELGHKEL